MNACEFYDCDRPQAPDQPATGMRLCAEHDAEFTALVQANDFAGLLDFFSRSRGGPLRIAQDYVDHMAAANFGAAERRIS